MGLTCVDRSRFRKISWSICPTCAMLFPYLTRPGIFGRFKKVRAFLDFSLSDLGHVGRPYIYSEYKNLLLVCPTEVLHVKEKKNGLYVSLYLRSKTPHSLVSAPACCRLSTPSRAITPRSSPRPAGQSSRRNLFHTSSTRSASTHFTLEGRHPLLFQIHDINIDDGGGAQTLASSGSTMMTLLRTVTTPSPSCSRWTTTASANRTTSKHSCCTSRSTCVMS